MPLKKLHEQTIVITGASSGIGLTTARTAAKRGARLVLAARSEDALHELAREINQGGGQAIAVIADVAREQAVQRIADEAIKRFGGFDTWINNAGVGMFGEVTAIPIEDMRHLFDTNFWGVVYGSREAATHLRARGGAIINIGSALSDRAIPLQGVYAASAHAIKGFTDSLRMELEAEGAPVSVTLIKPGAIDTPYPHNAKNFMEVEPKQPSPVYAPETVADAILHCAQTSERDVIIGAGGKGISLGQYAPRIADKLMELSAVKQQKGRPPSGPLAQNALDGPSPMKSQRGGHQGHVARTSLYTQASLHPLLVGAVALGAGIALLLMQRRSRSDDSRRLRAPPHDQSTAAAL